MPADGEFNFTVDLQDGYRFEVDFAQDGVPSLVMDEPEPLGEGSGPTVWQWIGVNVVGEPTGNRRTA